MIYWYKIINLILIVLYILCLKKIKKYNLSFSPIFFFLIGIIYFILFPFSLLTWANEFTLNPLSGAKGYWATVNLKEDTFIYPYLVISISLFLCSLLVLIMPLGNKLFVKNNKFQIDSRISKKVNFIMIISMMLISSDLLLRIIQFGGLANFLNSHWYMRTDYLFEKYGRLYVLIIKIFQTNMIIFVATSFLYTMKILYEKTEFKSKLFLFVIVIFHLLIIFFTGNRIYFALYLLMVGFSVVIYRQKKLMILGIIFVPMLLVTFSAWSYTRSMLYDLNTALSSYFESLKYLDNALLSILFDITEGANILLVFHIINDYGNKYDYLSGATYFKVLTSFFPGLTNKIDSFTVITGNNYAPGTNVSLNSTIIGELYANFGIISILFLPIFAFFFILLSKKINLSTYPFISIILGALIIWFTRSVFSDNFIIAIIAICLLYIELTLYKVLVKISSKSI